MPRLFLTAVLLLLTAAGAFAQEAQKNSPDVLTLTAAIVEAQQNNRSIKISIQGVLYANDAILAAKTQRYPQFNVELIGSGLLQSINVTIPQNALGPSTGHRCRRKTPLSPRNRNSQRWLSSRLTSHSRSSTARI